MQKKIVIGLGQSGLSAARYLARQQSLLAVIDSRQSPLGLTDFKREFPSIPIFLGDLDQPILQQADEIVVSPGVTIQQPLFTDLAAMNKVFISDVELFVRAAKAPIVAITGTNGKSTVVSLLGQMIAEAQIPVKIGGNLGTPALELLDDNAQIYVLELSSFQLETTPSLRAQIACILNVTPDHLDRYDSFSDYADAKQNIFNNASHCIFNREDELTYPKKNDHTFSFGASKPRSETEFGLITSSDLCYLARGEEKLDLAPVGKHHGLNALAALAIGSCLSLPLQSMRRTLRNFQPLEHRVEFVEEMAGVTWYNDSKGTNVGATIAAIESLAPNGNIILLAGGQSKGADMRPLRTVIERHVSHVLLFGEDAANIAKQVVIPDKVACVGDMTAAITRAAELAKPGDQVLLSPACASFDRFANYQERGQVFKKGVRCLADRLVNHRVYRMSERRLDDDNAA